MSFDFIDHIFQTHYTHYSNHYTHYKCMGFVIITKPNFSSSFFIVFTQSVTVMSLTAFVTVQVVRSCHCSGCRPFDVSLAINY